MNNQYCYVVSFSGGKDSTAMLLKLLEEKKKIDYILFVDLGAEYPEMYKHIQQVNTYLTKNFNLKITTLKPKFSMIHYIVSYKRKYGPYRGYPYGFPSYKCRWCTGLKKDILNHFFTKLQKPVINYIGFTADESGRANRLKRKCSRKRVFRFPLIESGIHSNETLDYCYSFGFDWNGLYTHLERASCFLCPFQRDKELWYLINNRPELWKQIKELEAKVRSTGLNQWKFRPSESCDEIEKRLLKRRIENETPIR